MLFPYPLLAIPDWLQSFALATAGAWAPLLYFLAFKFYRDWKRRSGASIEIRPISTELIASPDAGLDPPSVDQLRLESLRRRLDEQMRTIDLIDTRVVNQFGIASTILPISIAIIGYVADRQAAREVTASSQSIAAPETILHMPWELKMPILIALIFYLACIGVFLNASRHGSASFRPEVDSLTDMCNDANSTGIKVRRWLAAEYADSIGSNTRLLAKKELDQKRTSYLLGFEAFALGVAAFALIWQI